MMPLFPDRMNVLREYLAAEVLDKQVSEADRQFCANFKLPINYYHPRVPLQSNGTDCGLFLLENVEGFL